MRISISGPPGSGKTTVCMQVAKKLDYDYVLVGQIFRQMALERRMDLDTFGRLAEEDETIDLELDQRMLTLARANEDIVLEGRLTGPLLRHKNIPVFAVFVTADERVRAERIAQRESRDVEHVLKEMRARERSEKKRYHAYYGIDLNDRAIYDLWIDSTKMSADRVTDMIVAKVRKAEHDDAGEVEETG